MADNREIKAFFKLLADDAASRQGKVALYLFDRFGLFAAFNEFHVKATIPF